MKFGKMIEVREVSHTYPLSSFFPNIKKRVFVCYLSKYLTNFVFHDTTLTPQMEHRLKISCRTCMTQNFTQNLFPASVFIGGINA